MRSKISVQLKKDEETGNRNVQLLYWHNGSATAQALFLPTEMVADVCEMLNMALDAEEYHHAKKLTF